MIVGGFTGFFFFLFQALCHSVILPFCSLCFQVLDNFCTQSTENTVDFCCAFMSSTTGCLMS